MTSSSRCVTIEQSCHIPSSLTLLLIYAVIKFLEALFPLLRENLLYPAMKHMKLVGFSPVEAGAILFVQFPFFFVEMSDVLAVCSSASTMSVPCEHKFDYCSIILLLSLWRCLLAL